MCSTNLDNILEIVTLLFQGLVQEFQSRQGSFHHHFGQGNVHGRRKGIVTGLSLVDMIVGMDWRFGPNLSSQNLNGAVGQDLVDIHIRLRA